MKKKNVFAQTFLVTSVFILILLNNFNAQPSLALYEYYINWPKISLSIRVMCGSELRSDVTASNFILLENGVDINNFTITCQHGDGHCCTSVAFVVDRGTKMGEGNPTLLDNAKNGIKAFVDAMDGICDEAILMSFSDNVRVNVPITTDKVFIERSSDSLKAGGGQVVWDALYASINELDAQATQYCRGVIVFTQGNDVGSCHSFDDVMTRAIQNNIPVYTIGYGVEMNENDLSKLAIMTGGKFYKVTDPSQLVSVYKDISTIMRGGFYVCELVYNTKRSDIKERTISLTLQKLFGCPGTDTKVQKIDIPVDTIPFPLHINLDTAKTYGREQMRMPFTYNSLRFSTQYNVSFSVLFDSSIVKFDTLLLPDYSNRYLSQKIQNGINFRMLNDTYLFRQNTIATLQFTAHNVNKDTSCVLKLTDWLPQDPNYKIILHDGLINIYARNPRANCRYIQAPAELIWDQIHKKYSPNPFAVGFSIGSCDDIIASSARATISFDTTKLSLDNPKTFSQPCIPDFIDQNTSAFATWQLFAKQLRRTDTVAITCTFTFTNSVPIVCSTNVIIPKSPLVDVENISSPTSFYLGQNYPNPFTRMTNVEFGIRNESNSALLTPNSALSFKIYDVFGREVLDLSKTVIGNFASANLRSSLVISNSQLPSQGIYFYRLTIGNQSQTRMMMMMVK